MLPFCVLAKVSKCRGYSLFSKPFTKIFLVSEFFFELKAHGADMHLNQWQAIIFMKKVQKPGSHGIVSIFMFEFW